MKYNPDIHHRHTIRLKNYDYSCAGMYFITICIDNRECLLGEIIDGQMHLNAIGQIAAQTWQWLASHHDYVTLDEWVIMPNHIHGILSIVDDPTKGSAQTTKRKPVGRLVGAFKTVSTKHINIMRESPGSKLWQRNYWEHIVRNEQSLQQIREYIANNPQTWADDQLNPAFVNKIEQIAATELTHHTGRGGSQITPTTPIANPTDTCPPCHRRGGSRTAPTQSSQSKR